MCPEAHLLKEIPLFELLDDRERKILPIGSRLSVSRLTLQFFKSEIRATPSTSSARAKWKSSFVMTRVSKSLWNARVRAISLARFPFLRWGCRSASVRATTETEVLRLDRDDLAKFLESRPRAAMHLLAAMGRRLRTTVERLRHTASRNVNAQIAESHSLLHKIIDSIAEFAGSIPFLMIHVVLFTVWLTVNSVQIPGIPQFDPIPLAFLRCRSLWRPFSCRSSCS